MVSIQVGSGGGRWAVPGLLHTGIVLVHVDDLRMIVVVGLVAVPGGAELGIPGVSKRILRRPRRRFRVLQSVLGIYWVLSSRFMTQCSGVESAGIRRRGAWFAGYTS